MARKVVIQKVDLDTALTAFILGVSEEDDITPVRDKASADDLLNPNVICIECGGSGQVELSNFDHHDTDEELPPACVQAYKLYGDDEHLNRLVEYVSTVDIRGPELVSRCSDSAKAFPTLSDLFSGMLLITPDPKDQLLRGIEILRRVMREEIDPFGVMPEDEEWGKYIEAKRRNKEEIKRALDETLFFRTKGGLKAGFIKSNVIGVLGALYRMGCKITIAYSPAFGDPPVPKYTIAGDGIRVDTLLKVLNEIDPGWGGPAHGTIIGSPRKGSKLSPQEVIDIVKRWL